MCQLGSPVQQVTDVFGFRPRDGCGSGLERSGRDRYQAVSALDGFADGRNLKKDLPPLPPDYALSIKEPFIEAQPTSIPSLNILIQIVGSRGDVQPYLSLAIELVICSHRVRIASHDDFKDFVLVTGKRVLRRRWLERHKREVPQEALDRLEFFPIGGSPKELMAYMVRSECLGRQR